MYNSSSRYYSQQHQSKILVFDEQLEEDRRLSELLNSQFPGETGSIQHIDHNHNKSQQLQNGNYQENNNLNGTSTTDNNNNHHHDDDIKNEDELLLDNIQNMINSPLIKTDTITISSPPRLQDRTGSSGPVLGGNLSTTSSPGNNILDSSPPTTTTIPTLSKTTITANNNIHCSTTRLSSYSQHFPQPLNKPIFNHSSSSNSFLSKLSASSLSPDKTVIVSAYNNTKYKIKDLVTLLKEPGSGLQIRDRYQNFQAHKQCFSGSELIEWLIQHGICLNKNQAIQLDSIGVNDDQIYALVQLMKSDENGVKRMDRSRFLKKFKDCFVGSEAVTWILKNCTSLSNRDDALRLGQEMMNKGYITVASTSKDFFKDDSSFYIFRNILYSGYLGKRSKSRPEWKVKWFALRHIDEHVLWYYESPRDPTPINGISLTNAYIRECECGGGCECFEIVTHERIFCLKTSNIGLLKIWVEFLSSHTTSISEENSLFEQAESAIQYESIKQSEYFLENYGGGSSNGIVNGNSNSVGGGGSSIGKSLTNSQSSLPNGTPIQHHHHQIGGKTFINNSSSGESIANHLSNSNTTLPIMVDHDNTLNDSSSNFNVNNNNNNNNENENNCKDTNQHQQQEEENT
eukprot:gene5664-7050_t